MVENGVWKRISRQSHKSRMRQASASKPANGGVFLGNEISIHPKVAAGELAWASYTDRHALSYGCLDCSMRLSKVTFPDSEVVTKIFCGQTKGEILITGVSVPYSVELILLSLTNHHAFYSISAASHAPNHGNKKMFFLALRYFDLKNGVSDRRLDSYEDLNETAEIIKQKAVGILPKYKLDLAPLPAYSSDSTNVRFLVALETLACLILDWWAERGLNGK